MYAWKYYIDCFCTTECDGIKFSCMLQALGIVVLAVGIWALVANQDFAVVTGNSIASGAAILIVAGIVTLIICIIGIIGAIFKLRPMLLIVSCLSVCLSDMKQVCCRNARTWLLATSPEVITCYMVTMVPFMYMHVSICSQNGCGPWIKVPLCQVFSYVECNYSACRWTQLSVVVTSALAYMGVQVSMATYVATYVA